jgi:hypothetical protein
MRKALNGQLIGTVLWFSDRDGNGIILDENKKEYYFDTSVWKNKTLKPLRTQLVKFDLNESIKDCKCAKNVSDLLA